MGRASKGAGKTGARINKEGAKKVDYEVNQSWTAVYQSIARRMLCYSDKREALKVSTKELKEEVVSK